MTFLQPDAAPRLKVAGFRKPLRLRSLGRVGALETFAVEGETVQAVRFAPIPEAASASAAALDAFEALGRRLEATAPRAALPVQAVVRTASGVFWLQPQGGPTLETWLNDHPGPVAGPLVAAFSRRLAEALTELHDAGLVHGDLSPRAVLIGGGAVRLTGFMVDRRPFFRVLRSQEGLVEPGYAPPEGHDGALRHPIGPAADLYAASALLQRMLTGRPPPAANQPARLAGETFWPSDVAVSPGLRAGVEAGLSPVAEARPPSAAAWLSSLALEPASEHAWFAGLAPDAEPEPLALPDALGLPPPPVAAEPGPVETTPAAETPLILAREGRVRRRIGWWVAGLGLAAVSVAGVALVATRPLQTPPGPGAVAARAAAPTAPAGCQWISAGGAWRLRCADAPPQGLRLPERFDVRTPDRAAGGEPAAMERLGAFYRLRAGETANPERGAYAYQALDWLRRASDAPADGRPDTARARDDAALALGQMLAHGEGGRAPDPAAAETRLRQAAAGSRADAVLALAQFLEGQAGEDADRRREARGLYARVAQLRDGSALQRDAERGLARIDAAPKPPPLPVETQPAPRPETPVAEGQPAKPAPRRLVAPARPRPAPAKPRVEPKPAKVRSEPAKPIVPVVRVARKAAPVPQRPPVTAAPAHPSPPAAVLRTWTASTFIRVDPSTNYSASVELAGRAACDSEGGQTLSVRAGDTLCPNGVNYCQVRAVATCQGARP